MKTNSLVRTLLYCLLLLGVIFLVSCGQREEVVKVGFAGVMSGPDAQFGTRMMQGAQIALEEWNAKGGVLGKRVEFVVRDDEGKPNQAVSVAHELIAQKVVGVIGHFNSGCTIPSSTIFAEAGVLQITPASTSPLVTERGIETLFRLCGRDDQQAEVSADFARRQLGLETVAVLHNKTPYGQGLAEEFKKQFESLGGQVAIFQGLGSEELDFRASIASMREHNVQGVFWGGMYAQAGPLFNQLRQTGLTIPFFGGDGIYEREFVLSIGANAQDVYITFSPDYRQAPSAQSFLEKYRARFGEEGPYSIYGYEAMNILLQAIQTTQSTRANELAKWMRGQTFSTSMGDVSFDGKGDLTKANYVIWTIDQGAFKVVDSKL